MSRQWGADMNGQPFDEKTIKAVWRKGEYVEMMHQDVWRYDSRAGLLKFEDYLNPESEYGWEVDHIKPVSAGGTDDLANLQPLHWKTNREKGDQYPWEPEDDPWPQSRF